MSTEKRGMTPEECAAMEAKYAVIPCFECGLLENRHAADCPVMGEPIAVIELPICENPACAAPLTADRQCSKCGISHTHPGCPECGRTGFHKDGCSLIGEYIG